MDLKSVRDAFDEVVKNQELVTTGYKEAIDKIENEIKEAITKIQSVDHPSVDHESVITDLKKKLEMIWPQKQLEKSEKDLNKSLTKYPKVLGKIVDPDISKAYRNVEFDSHIVNQIILTSLYHDGLFDIADTFTNESQEPAMICLRSEFKKMHYIINALRARNLEPALTWVLVNREKLNENRSNLEFELHRLQYLELVRNANKSDAMTYFETHLKPLSSNHRKEVLKLMGCLLWSGKLETSPYVNVLSGVKWEEVVKELTKQFCTLIEVSLKNPLSVTVEAGAIGLPTLLKLARVMSMNQQQEWETMKKLPVAIDLGRELEFHSVFICPVTQEESKEPMMVSPCGHLLCRHSISKLPKNNENKVKCPICNCLVEKCWEMFL